MTRCDVTDCPNDGAAYLLSGIAEITLCPAHAAELVPPRPASTPASYREVGHEASTVYLAFGMDDLYASHGGSLPKWYSRISTFHHTSAYRRGVRLEEQ